MPSRTRSALERRNKALFSIIHGSREFSRAGRHAGDGISRSHTEKGDMMTAHATIQQIYCLRHATGTDAGVVEGLAGLVPMKLLSELNGATLGDFVKGLPNVTAAIDSARADPDNLYITTTTSGDLDESIWPPGHETVDMRADQSQAPGISVPVEFSQNISLWDHDVSRDDLLGSITILESERGAGQIAKLAKSEVESSYYYVTYEVQ
jgi:hypothetical protein